jgi:hypothetical protein
VCRKAPQSRSGTCQLMAGNLILAVRLEIKAHPGGSSIYVHFLGVKKCS